MKSAVAQDFLAAAGGEGFPDGKCIRPEAGNEVSRQGPSQGDLWIGGVIESKEQLAAGTKHSPQFP
jgi:hypothetical protein